MARADFIGFQRRRPKVPPRPSLLVVCEGEKTEYRYFRNARRLQGIRLLKIEVEQNHSDPVSVVRTAIRLKDEAADRARRFEDDNERFDEVWCAIDVDRHAKLDQALSLAAENSIGVAISNPCFELWILLHVCEQSAELSAQQAKAACRKAIKGFTGTIPFAMFGDEYFQALTRAKKLDRVHTGKQKPGNPCTRVYLLTEKLSSMGKSALLKQLKQTGRK